MFKSVELCKICLSFSLCMTCLLVNIANCINSMLTFILDATKALHLIYKLLRLYLIFAGRSALRLFPLVVHMVKFSCNFKNCEMNFCILKLRFLRCKVDHRFLHRQTVTVKDCFHKLLSHASLIQITHSVHQIVHTSEIGSHTNLVMFHGIFPAHHVKARHAFASLKNIFKCSFK